jgi:hypothetical protein
VAQRDVRQDIQGLEVHMRGAAPSVLAEVLVGGRGSGREARPAVDQEKKAVSNANENFAH